MDGRIGPSCRGSKRSMLQPDATQQVVEAGGGAHAVELGSGSSEVRVVVVAERLVQPFEHFALILDEPVLMGDVEGKVSALVAFLFELSGLQLRSAKARSGENRSHLV